MLGNFPLFFALHLAGFLGFLIEDTYSERTPFLDLREGRFVNEHPQHPYLVEGRLSSLTAELLRVRQPEELQELALNQDMRRSLLHAYSSFYALHIADFGELRTLAILQTILA